MTETEKVHNYMPLICELQQLYRGYTYEIISIVKGTLGAIPESLEKYLEGIGLTMDMNDIVRRIYLVVPRGTVKAVLRMNK